MDMPEVDIMEPDIMEVDITEPSISAMTTAVESMGRGTTALADGTAQAASDEDKNLARRCACGDEQALRQIFEAHEPSLRRLLFRMVRNMDDAEELSAEVFIRFWKSAGRFRGDCSLKAYLTRIALNLGKDRLRRRRPVAQQVAPQREHPLMSEIEEGLAKLDYADREVLTLYYLDDLSYEEIASALGISYDVLRTRLVRARKRLRAAIGVDE
jgi:RNA polymerase sigma-70 factor, ECF subfamily